MTGNQELLAELGLGGHSAQNWAFHTTAFCPCTSLQEDDSVCWVNKGRKQQNWAKNLLVEVSEKRQMLNLERFLKFILFIYFYW